MHAGPVGGPISLGKAWNAYFLTTTVGTPLRDRPGQHAAGTRALTSVICLYPLYASSPLGYGAGGTNAHGD